MSHVFVSYKREDEDRVARLVAALKDDGLSPWWDRDLVGGQSWREQAQAALDAAACTIVVWTKDSVGPRGGFVRDEASRAHKRGVLLPVLLDRVEPPLGFGEVQAWDLVGWSGSRRDPRYADLRAAVRARLQGRPAPPPQAPLRRLARRLSYGSLGSAALVAVLVVGSNQFGVQDRLCRLPALQPRLGDACGALGIGGQPTREERLAWQNRETASCAALRSHVERFPQGAYSRAAAELLAARRVTSTTVWTPGTRTLVLEQPPDDGSHRDESAARAAALQRARTKAEQLCQGFAATTRFRLTSATPAVQAWKCTRHAAGVACGLEGAAVCALEERSDLERESCGP